MSQNLFSDTKLIFDYRDFAFRFFTNVRCANGKANDENENTIYKIDINLKKLESMPLDDGAYGFYLSLEEPADSPALGEALTSIEEYGTVFRWLGTYPEALC